MWSSLYNSKSPGISLRQAKRDCERMTVEKQAESDALHIHARAHTHAFITHRRFFRVSHMKNSASLLLCLHDMSAFVCVCLLAFCLSARLCVCVCVWVRARVRVFVCFRVRASVLVALEASNQSLSRSFNNSRDFNG